MRLTLALIGLGIILFIINAPGTEQIHRLAWILGVTDALLVVWSWASEG